MNTITLTDEQMKALQSGQPITIEPPKQPITKWEPKGGDYIIDHLLNTITFKNGFKNELWINSGLIYQTESQAEQAAKALRSYARQLAWLAENDDGWVANWENPNQYKHYVYFHNVKQMYHMSHDYSAKSIGLVYMSENNAQKLCQLLNDGIVEF
jgi:hypothetical protein